MNATINDVEHATIRAALSTIVERDHGVLNPHAVLEVAAAPDHPLHRFFEWDDTAAAQAYRLAQVGMLARRVKLHVLRMDPTTRELRVSTTRAYQSRPSMRTSAGGYEPIADIIRDPIKRRELLATALRDLNVMRQRYDLLEELQGVWQALDEASETISESSPPLSTGGETAPGAAV